MTRKSKTMGRALMRVLMCLTVAAVTFSSCKKEPADVSDLLKTVPSSASAVIGVNLGTILEKAGCKVEGADITPGAELQAFAQRSRDSKVPSEVSKGIDLFLSGDSGIDPTGALLFVDAYDTYMTAMIADTPKFLEYARGRTGKEFTDEKDVKVSGNVAVYGAQAWVSLGSGTIDPKAVRNYATQGEAQSFMTNSFAGQLAHMTHDIVGWGKIKAFAHRGISFTDFATVNVLTGMLFEGASSVSFDVDFLKGELQCTGAVLNDEGKPAKYLLPADKLDTPAIESLADNASAVVAMSVTKEMVKKIEKLSTSLGGNAFGAFTNLLQSLDGTQAVAFGNLNDFSSSFSALITTDGTPTLELMQLLSSFAPTQKDGKVVRIKKGTVAGGLDLKEVAKQLKGATMGIVIDGNDPRLKTTDDGVASLAFAIRPDDGGIRFSLGCQGTDKDENMLLTIIKHLK